MTFAITNHCREPLFCQEQFQPAVTNSPKVQVVPDPVVQMLPRALTDQSVGTSPTSVRWYPQGKADDLPALDNAVACAVMLLIPTPSPSV